MPNRKPLWDVLSEDTKKQVLDRIIAYFLDERGEQIGYIAAEGILDTVMGELFSEIYNKGVLDAQKVVREKSADIDAEIDLLLKSN